MKRAMKKLADIIAIVCGITCLLFATALDSPSMIPAYICLGTLVYLMPYMILKVRYDNGIYR